MKHCTRLGEHQEAQVEQNTQPAPLEFLTPEEMLRHDAIHTPVPPSIEKRLRASAAPLAPVRPWWRKLFGQ